MAINIILTLSLVALLVLALFAARVVRRPQRALLREREALQHQRGALHTQQIAYAAQTLTGRVDIGLALLELATQLWEQAVRLAPRQPSLAAALRTCKAEIADRRRPDAQPAGLPTLDPGADLATARLQLTEALRMLGRVEKQGWIETAELQTMTDSIQQALRAIDLRLHLRQVAQSSDGIRLPEEQLEQVEPSTQATPRR
jgi:hypothetical protein